MGQLSFEREVEERLQGQYHLQPIFYSAYDIPRRLREYDPALFVVWNTGRECYEVHSLAHIGSTYAADVPGNCLDARVEEVIRMGDLRIRGNKILTELFEHNKRVRERRERDAKNRRESVAEMLQPAFAKMAWEGV